MFNKILIANRGEIACRIIKTTKKMGIESVVVYSEADRNSLHVSLADSAFYIGPSPATSSYLNIDAIITAALDSGAQAIHPGYGFLSENPQFAQACSKAGLIFIGPTIAAMEAMASKQVAKQRLEKTNIPLTPGYHGKDQSDERLLQEAKRIGFPVLLKAASGGGGKGMRSVYKEADFYKDLAGARREAKASFGDDIMLIEKLISKPRHVEIQIMADNHGNIVHLHERDCSIQRRHQKIIEEAPAPHLSETLRQGLADSAVEVARTIDYRGAGTVEFLVDGQHFYFMEMNTRLQVEHPVTEMITGLDLVEWQLRIAADERLPCSQAEITVNGHAIECRVYAEDPQNGFIPSIGQLHFLKVPTGTGIRVDTGVEQNSFITMFYDPMIAKLIAWGKSREEALQRIQQALKHYHIGGVKTNISFLQAITHNASFIKAQINTHFLNEQSIEIPTADKQLALFMTACVDYLDIHARNQDPLQQDTFAWQINLKTRWSTTYIINDDPYNLTIIPINPYTLTLKLADKTTTFKIKWDHQQRLTIDDGKTHHQVWVEHLHDQFVLYIENGPVVVKRFDGQISSAQQQNKANQLTAPMPGTVVAILKNKGDSIKAGDRLIVLEAMKMEHTIHAPYDGLLVDIFYSIGAQVNEGAQLVALETEA